MNNVEYLEAGLSSQSSIMSGFWTIGAILLVAGLAILFAYNAFLK